jgi:hypothetical protein
MSNQHHMVNVHHTLDVVGPPMVYVLQAWSHYDNIGGDGPLRGGACEG